MHPGFITQKSPLRSTSGWWVWPNSRISAPHSRAAYMAAMGPDFTCRVWPCIIRMRLVRAAIVAVAGHPQQRDLGIQPPQPVRVPDAVPQMEDGLGLHQLHALLHRVHAPVGIG